MPRPRTKAELLEAATTGYDTLHQLIESMSDNEKTATFDFGPNFHRDEPHWTRDQNLRDVLAHLAEWHLLLITWVRAHQAGSQRPFLPEPHTWRTTPALNTEIHQKHQQTPLPQIHSEFTATHTEVVDLIKEFTDEELFTKEYFSWTGTTSLGSYCVSATSSHYDWAKKKLRTYLKATRTATNP